MGNYEYAYIIEAARLVTNIEAAITSALFDISDHSARHENGGVDVLSLAGLAVAIGDVTGHDTALHDGLNINADTVDTKHASDLQFAQNEEISLGCIPLAIYTPQSVTGTTHTKLKIIDNATALEFRISHQPSAPGGWTLRGRLYAILKEGEAGYVGYIELYNDTDTTQVVEVQTSGAIYKTLKSGLFTIPVSIKTLSLKIWNYLVGKDTYCAGAWIEFIAVKD